MKKRPRILLIHGLILSPLSMVPLGAFMAKEGWSPSYFAYSSLIEPTASAQRRLREALSDEGPTHIIAHSLGGLMALETLVANPDLPVKRVVCMGSPLRGSSAALGLHRWPLASLIVGQSDGILRRGVTSWPEHLEVGMLAGQVPMGLGAGFAGFGDKHDGTVSVDETNVPSLTEHKIVNASHTGMLVDTSVARKVDRFLRSGRFSK